jgi:hypothetical protein
MRRRPNICDACVRLRKRSNPESETSLDRWIPYCDAFPERVPNEIYRAGFDHRNPFEGDHGIRFELRPGGERALAAYESSVARKESRRRDAEDSRSGGPGQGG